MNVIMWDFVDRKKIQIPYEFCHEIIIIIITIAMIIVVVVVVNIIIH